ncbi:MAG: hypothetical protein GF350_16680, partial [Chitinivibrionales bacterium]|nr:hypothetical protein [Chitinivibrionales bacterium]
MTKSDVLFILLVAGVLLIQCTVDPVSTNGGTGSTTETAMVAGILYHSDGVTPAVGVRVAIRPRNTLADTSGLGLPKRMADTATVMTDDSGRFVFDSTLDTGTYVIEAASGNDAVLIDSVTVQDPDTNLDLPPDTLRPAGALKGVVRLSEGGDPRKVFVLAFGIDRFASVDSLGRFRFEGLAEAGYDLRLISSLDDYGVLDLRGVAVTSADTTDLDTLELPFEGIPTPKGLSLTYDTLRQIVTITWSEADTARVSGYNVYRKHPDSSFVKINASLIEDTTFADSALSADGVYEYLVTAVDPSTNEGQRSSAITVGFQSRFKLATSSAPFGMRRAHSTVVFDSAMWVLGGWSSTGQYNNDVWRSIDGTTWEQVSDSTEFPRRKQHASVESDGKLWVIGGLSDIYDRLNDVWYSTDGQNWQLATDSAGFSPRYGHSCVTFQGRIWVIGGVAAGGTPLNDVWSSQDGIVWEEATAAAEFPAREGQDAAVFAGEIWIIGGTSGGIHLADVWHSTDGTAWAQTAPEASFGGRYLHAIASNDSLIWIS